MLRSRLQLREKLKEKLVEALQAVLPIVAIVLVLSFFIAPLSPSVLLCFLLGAVMIIFGMMFFTLGAEMSMTPMGERVGSAMTKSRSLPKMIVIGFILGFIITISEPDLQVLANQVPSVPNLVLILSVAAGVGAFLVIALLRMLFSMALPPLLVTLYAIVFVLAAFVPKDFLAVAFDSGGVTTGPMTVPFIMALGVGISAIRSDRHAADDSFGLVALCSIGPILAVLILGIAYSPGESSYTAAFLPDIQDSVELWDLFMVGLPAYFKEIALSLLPIMVFFGVYQFAVLHMSRKALGKILVGLFYTYIGLVLFLTGANVGFMPAGNYLGQVLAALPYRWVLIPLGMLIGYFIVKAEPAVYVLNKQVEEVTDGSISAKAMGASLSIGVALSVGLAMLRVLTGISILWMLVPGYGIAIASGSLFLSALYEFGINVVFIALAAEAVLLLLRVPLKRDLNGDGIVTAEENAEVDELSHKVRRRIIVGTVVFAIPCIVMTAGSVDSAQAGVQDGYGVTETTRELAAVLPGFKDYTVAVETSATEGEEEGVVEREIVAHVTTSEALGAHDRRVARKLIDLNVPELDRVEFDVK